MEFYSGYFGVNYIYKIFKRKVMRFAMIKKKNAKQANAQIEKQYEIKQKQEAIRSE